MATRKYRGRYPTRIKQIEGLRGGKTVLTTNDGRKWLFIATDNGVRRGPIEVGQELHMWVVKPYVPDAQVQDVARVSTRRLETVTPKSMDDEILDAWAQEGVEPDNGMTTYGPAIRALADRLNRWEPMGNPIQEVRDALFETLRTAEQIGCTLDSLVRDALDEEE